MLRTTERNDRRRIDGASGEDFTMTAFRSMTLPLFALVAALAGCSAEAGTSAGAESTGDARSNVVAEQAAKEESGKGGHRVRAMAHRPTGGPDFLVHAALRAPINLTAEQKATIEGLVKATAPRGHERNAAGAQKLAAAIRSNSVEGMDPPKLDESARQARIAASAKALATLHDTLTPEQRVALVDGITKRAAEHGQKHGQKHGERGPRPDGERGFRGRGGPGGPGGAPMALLAGLDLTQEQKDAIKTKLDAQRPAKPTAEQREAMKAKMESMRAGMQAKLESFKADQFDATAFVTPPKDLVPREGAVLRGHANPLAVITPVLTPAQREALAARIEKGPMKPMMHEGRMKGPKLDAPKIAK